MELKEDDCGFGLVFDTKFGTFILIWKYQISVQSVGVEFNGKSAYSEKKIMVFTGSQKTRTENDYSILALFLILCLWAWAVFCWFRWSLDLTQNRILPEWCLGGSSPVLGLLSWPQTHLKCWISRVWDPDRSQGHNCCCCFSWSDSNLLWGWASSLCHVGL